MESLRVSVVKIKFVCLIVLGGFLLLGALGHSMAAPAEATPVHEAQAGWAEVDITPPLGIGLGGRGGPETVAKRVLDPLYAQVTYLKDGHGKGFLLLSLDIVAIPHDLSDRIRLETAQELGVDWDLIVINTSHTHSGPYMIRSLMAGVGPAPAIERDYFDFLCGNIRAAVREAQARLQPVAVKTFKGQSDVGINRRGKNAQGQRGIIPDPDGPYESQVWVLNLIPANGAAQAVIFSYACHPVIVYGYAPAAISADFPGVARNWLREKLGPKTHAQFVQGFAGNIRPRIVADVEHHRFRAPKPEDLQSAGQSLADSVLAAMQNQGRALTLEIAAGAGHPFLPRGEPPPRSTYEKIQADSLVKTNKFRLAVSQYWLERYDAKNGFARGDVWSLGLIRLAPDQWIVYSGGEPCIEWRAKIATWLPGINFVPWGYSQEARSYLPTEELLPQGGYEVLESNEARASTPAPFTIGIESAVRQSLLRQMAFINAKTK
jgi:hypothetical protein